MRRRCRGAAEVAARSDGDAILVANKIDLAAVTARLEGQNAVAASRR